MCSGPMFTCSHLGAIIADRRVLHALSRVDCLRGYRETVWITKIDAFLKICSELEVVFFCFLGRPPRDGTYS